MAKTVERIVGVSRHDTQHLARLVSAEQQVYILHPVGCIETIASRGSYLRACEYARALDEGIDLNTWRGFEDQVVTLAIDAERGGLLPTICGDTPRRWNPNDDPAIWREREAFVRRRALEYEPTDSRGDDA